jgi:tRNA (guanosine-2'-O-)-methyltransferase
MKNTDNLRGRSFQWYIDRIDCLAPFALDRRMETLRRRLEQRTRHITILTENTFHPQNASALIRTADAFGVQDIHVVETLCRFRPNVDIVRGSDKWIDLRRHSATAEAIAALRGSGYRLVAASPRAGSRTPLDLDVEAGRIALMFGAEHAGLSDEALAAADDFVHIPMVGMVESLNLSASAAILLYNLSARLRLLPAALWQLTAEEQAETLFFWLMSTVRDSGSILEKFEK